MRAFLVILSLLFIFGCKTQDCPPKIVTNIKYDTITIDKYISDTVEIQKLIAQSRADAELIHYLSGLSYKPKRIKKKNCKEITNIINCDCDSLIGGIVINNTNKDIGKIKGVKIKHKNNNNKKEKVTVKKTSLTLIIIFIALALICGFILGRKSR